MSHGFTEATTSPRGQGSGRKDNRTDTVLCGWTLERLLGIGPVCESWLAARPGAPDSVVRVLREPFASDPIARAEWLGASWAANRFTHSRVPRVIQDGADARGAPLVIRLWASGRPLDDLASGSGIDPQIALQIAEQLLDALEMAHAHGVIHGALSPSNVIVMPGQAIRLLDFATARGLTEMARGLLRARVSPYMSPEQRAVFLEPDSQAACAVPTEQSDLWSVGACLHFAIAGKAPASEAPSLRRTVPDTDAGIGAVVDRALALDPLERYESAYAMLGDIRRVASGRRPRLQSAGLPLPSTDAGGNGGRESTSGVVRFEPSPRASRDVELPAQIDARGHGRSEWLRNLLVFAAIALMVAAATFVLGVAD
ncbi:MAG TPA: protein kinase [Polyangiaceae bacterium]|nr:protein kinase [Polyangiaceae bacterium]